MYVKIDTDILENILKAHARRQRHQVRIYGIILGTMEGNDSYHIKNCIFSYIYETADDSARDAESGPKVYILLNMF